MHTYDSAILENPVITFLGSGKIQNRKKYSVAKRIMCSINRKMLNDSNNLLYILPKALIEFQNNKVEIELVKSLIKDTPILIKSITLLGTMFNKYDMDDPVVLQVITNLMEIKGYLQELLELSNAYIDTAESIDDYEKGETISAEEAFSI